jgi:hypothetical protein
MNEVMLAHLSLLNPLVKPRYSGSKGIIVNMIKEELLSNETVASFYFYGGASPFALPF